MSKKTYSSGFERLSRLWSDTDERYLNALVAVRENFNGFTKKAGFDVNKIDRLTDAQKRQIRRYYNTLTTYTEGAPVYKMPPSELPKAIRKGGRKDVEKVMRAVQMPEGRKRAKYLFIKYDGKEKPKIAVKKFATVENGKRVIQRVPVVVNEHFGYSRETIEISPEALAIDPEAAIMHTASIVEGARFFRILNGRHEFGNYVGMQALINAVKNLQSKYGLHTKDRWDRWLFGYGAYYSDVHRADTIINHISETKEEFRKRVRKENAKIRRARK